jgi:hypothetical protein
MTVDPKRGLTLLQIATMRAYVKADLILVGPDMRDLAITWNRLYLRIDLDALAHIVAPDMDWARHRIVVGELHPLHGVGKYASSKEVVRWTW